MYRNKKIKTSNILDSIKTMTQELAWHTLKEIISSKKKLLSEFQRGGYKLVPKNRSRAKKLLIEKSSKSDYRLIFFRWYSEQSTYKEILDPYFISDEYKIWAEKRKLEEDEYALPDDRFNILYDSLTNKHALYFLHFSPIKFTRKQAEMFIKKPTSPVESDEKKKEESLVLSKQTAELIEKLKSEIRSLKKDQRRLKGNNINLQKQIDNYKKNEIIYREKIKEQNESLEKYRKEMDAKIKEADHRVSERLEKLKEEKARSEWKAKDYKYKFGKASRVLQSNSRQISNLKKIIPELKKTKNIRFQNILERIDTKELFDVLNEPDEVKELLSTLVKPPTGDDTSDARQLEINLKSFWNNLLKKEEEVLDKICLLKVDDIDESYYKNWVNHTDDFNDLIYSLRARAILIKMLHEILWQNREF